MDFSHSLPWMLYIYYVFLFALRILFIWNLKTWQRTLLPYRKSTSEWKFIASLFTLLLYVGIRTSSYTITITFCYTNSRFSRPLITVLFHTILRYKPRWPQQAHIEYLAHTSQRLHQQQLASSSS